MPVRGRRPALRRSPVVARGHPGRLPQGRPPAARRRRTRPRDARPGHHDRARHRRAVRVDGGGRRGRHGLSRHRERRQGVQGRRAGPRDALPRRAGTRGLRHDRGAGRRALRRHLAGWARVQGRRRGHGGAVLRSRRTLHLGVERRCVGTGVRGHRRSEGPRVSRVARRRRAAVLHRQCHPRHRARDGCRAPPRRRHGVAGPRVPARRRRPAVPAARHRDAGSAGDSPGYARPPVRRRPGRPHRGRRRRRCGHAVRARARALAGAQRHRVDHVDVRRRHRRGHAGEHAVEDRGAGDRRSLPHRHRRRVGTDLGAARRHAVRRRPAGRWGAARGHRSPRQAVPAGRRPVARNAARPCRGQGSAAVPARGQRPHAHRDRQRRRAGARRRRPRQPRHVDVGRPRCEGRGSLGGGVVAGHHAGRRRRRGVDALRQHGDARRGMVGVESGLQRLRGPAERPTCSGG